MFFDMDLENYNYNVYYIFKLINMVKFYCMKKGGVLIIYEVKYDFLWSEFLWNENIFGFMYVNMFVCIYDDVILLVVMEYGVFEV